MKDTISITKVGNPLLLGRASYNLKTADGTITAFELTPDRPVTGYLVRLNIFNARLDVCPHLLAKFCGFSEDPVLGSRDSDSRELIQIGCADCLKLEDMRKLVVGRFINGTFELSVLKFPGALYTCWAGKVGGYKGIYQGMGYESVSSWIIIAKESGFTYAKKISKANMEAMTLEFVKESI